MIHERVDKYFYSNRPKYVRKKILKSICIPYNICSWAYFKLARKEIKDDFIDAVIDVKVNEIRRKINNKLMLEDTIFEQPIYFDGAIMDKDKIISQKDGIIRYSHYESTAFTFGQKKLYIYSLRYAIANLDYQELITEIDYSDIINIDFNTIEEKMIINKRFVTENKSNLILYTRSKAYQFMINRSLNKMTSSIKFQSIINNQQNENKKSTVF